MTQIRTAASIGSGEALFEMLNSGNYVGLNEFADQLKVHRSTAWRWVKEGRLAATRVGKRYRVNLNDAWALVGTAENGAK